MAVRAALDWTNQLEEPTGQGKLLIWSGEPGTGKSTAARSLFRSWERWCSVEYIVDPERFFNDPGYMAEVIGRSTERTGRPSVDEVAQTEASWRLIVAEDVEDAILSSQPQGQGQLLSRLLNLADGVLGQGVNSLVLLTTNRPPNRLHPALVRPGRALATIEFTRLSASESATWLGDRFSPPGASTLAELFQLRHKDQNPGVAVAEPVATGQYL